MTTPTEVQELIAALRSEAKMWREQVGEMPIFDRAANALEALSVSPATEQWEYGTALRAESGEISGEWRSSSPEEAMADLARDAFEDHVLVIVKRTPGRDPGPWIPVEEGERSHDV